ncbi:MAG: adenylate kinase [Armatimonadetes bacterium]|nr:MAG: adenylate kinase [Armatimonadota bacterium]
MGRRILFLGPPGAGKGTQAEMLARALGVPHISTGVMLREAIAEGTELGKQVEQVVASGALVSDDLVLALVEERLGRGDAQCGYLLDGYPRNVVQAAALADVMGDDAIEVALLLNVDNDELVTRLLKRAADQGRADDTEDVIRHRLDVYLSETMPLIDHYGDAVTTVDGVGEIEEIFARIVLALAK